MFMSHLAAQKKKKKIHDRANQELWIYIILFITRTSSNTNEPRRKKICLWGFRGSDPGFLESGFICIKGWGFALLI